MIFDECKNFEEKKPLEEGRNYQHQGNLPDSIYLNIINQF